MNYFSYFFLLFVFLVITPASGFAHGSDQHIVDNRYAVSVSRAPYTPRVGMKAAFVIYIVDLQTHTLVQEDGTMSLRIAKLGEVNSKQQHYVFEKNLIAFTKGGAEFSYEFQEEGLHEIFIQFFLGSDPEKIYTPEDFLIDVGQPSRYALDMQTIALIFLLGAFLGFGTGRLMKRRVLLTFF